MPKPQDDLVPSPATLRPIFRRRALEQYLAASARAVPPPRAGRRLFVSLWVLALVLLLAAGGIALSLDRIVAGGEAGASRAATSPRSEVAR